MSSHWKQDFPIPSAEDSYVTRREFTKFLGLTSLAFFIGTCATAPAPLETSDRRHAAAPPTPTPTVAHRRSPREDIMPTYEAAAVSAVTWIALYAGHMVGDHIVQTPRQSAGSSSGSSSISPMTASLTSVMSSSLVRT